MELELTSVEGEFLNYACEQARIIETCMEGEKIKPGDIVIVSNNTLFSYIVISIDHETGVALCATPIEWEKEIPMKYLKKIADI